MKEPYQVVIRPLLTEKSVAIAGQGKYCFEVARDATKIDIGRALETLFPGVKVAKVNTLHVRGKERRTSGYGRRRRKPGRSPDWKKAVVTLREGKIPVFEGL
jgi:large subunit ribosomal protein L23